MTIDLYTVGACIVLAGVIAGIYFLVSMTVAFVRSFFECNNVRKHADAELAKQGELLAICSWRKDELEEKVRDAIQAAHDTNDLKAVLEILERSE